MRKINKHNSRSPPSRSNNCVEKSGNQKLASDSLNDIDDVNKQTHSGINSLSNQSNLNEQDKQGDLDEQNEQLHNQYIIKRDVNKRLDRYLLDRLKGISRNRIQQLIAIDGVKVNGKKPKPSTNLRAGDVVDVVLPPIAVRAIEPDFVPLTILHEEDGFIVLNKQAGLIIHPARSNTTGTLVNGLAYRFKQQREALGLEFHKKQTRGFGGKKTNKRSRKKTFEEKTVEGLSSLGASEFRPGIIHRLDKNTTGVIVVAKQDASHWAIAKQFEHRKTLKAYLAVVHGNFDEVGGVVDEPLGKHPTIREAHAVRRDHTAKNAVTIYRVREQYEGFSLIEVELKTGRTHQIRVHLSYLGHPLVGDIIYGGEPVGYAELKQPPIPAAYRKMMTFAREKSDGEKIESLARQRDDLIITHPALHATLLGFAHPTTQEFVRFTAPLHEPVATLIRELRKQPIDKPIAPSGYYIDLKQAISDLPNELEKTNESKTITENADPFSNP